MRKIKPFLDHLNDEHQEALHEEQQQAAEKRAILQEENNGLKQRLAATLDSLAQIAQQNTDVLNQAEELTKELGKLCSGLMTPDT